MKSLLLTTVAAITMTAAAASAQTVGFSQIGSESGWRAAETTLTKQQAEERGIDLKFSDAQQKQENQIAAIRAFVAQGVDAILL
ncbi:MAG: sugar ABC transporter substrate-binding protein, partial [Martelella sp.]